MVYCARDSDSDSDGELSPRSLALAQQFMSGTRAAGPMEPAQAALTAAAAATPAVARGPEAGLCAALLTYFGDAASPATDPREGWTADQRSSLQVLSLSLLQARPLV